MDSKTIFTKTAKGLGEISGKTKALPRDLRNILKEIDGKSPFAELAEKVSLAEPKLKDALNKLMADNYIREFAQPTLGENTRALDFSTIAPAASPAAPRKPAEPHQRRANDPALNVVSQAAPAISPNTEIQFAEFRRLQLEEQARHEARTKANKEADEKRRREQEAKVQRELEEWANKEVGDLVPEMDLGKPAPAAQPDVAAKAAEEAAMRAAAEQAKKQAEMQARQQAEELARREAELKARIEAEAKAKIEAEVKARVEAERARVEAEAKARLEAETAARKAAEEQARKAAEELARREAEARARKEADEKARRAAEDSARKAAEEKARQEAEQKARQEAEQKARHEVEQKARQEAEQKARQEAEQKIRQEAEAKAKKAAEEQARRAAEEKARIEAEQKARIEAEQQARRAAEEKARREAEQAAKEAEIRAAAAKAKQEAEERARKEAEQQARKAAEEKQRREAAEKMKAEQASEIDELARLQEQEQARAEAEARARKEAERAAQEQARKEAIEEARRKAQQVRQEAGQKIKQNAAEQEKKEAEDWVRQEVEERERRAAEARGEAAPEEEIEPDEHYDDEPEPHGEAEREDYVEHEPAEAVAQAESAMPAGRSEKHYRKSINWVKPLVAILVIAIVAGVGLLHVISFDGRIAALEKVAAEQLGQPVKIKSLYVALVPQPHWRIEGVSIGSEGQITAPKANAAAGLGALFGGDTSFKSIELETPVISEAGFEWLLFGKFKKSGLQLEQLRMTKAKLESQHLALGSFDATATMGSDGIWKKIVVDSAENRLHLQMTPKGEAMQIELSADSFKVPFGAGLALEHVSIDGTARPDDFELTQFRGSTMNGTLVGNAHLVKRDAGWKLTGQVTTTYMDAVQFAPLSLQAGKLNGDANFSADNRDLSKLLLAPRAEGNFSIRDGVLLGVDLASLLRNSNLPGKTNFGELSGAFLYEGGKLQLRNVGLTAGLLGAKGSLDMDQDKNLAGRFLVEIKSTSVQSRGNLTVGGNLKEPSYSR